MGLVRLVVMGSVGAGKSTFVRMVSDVEAVDTDRAATDETAQIKRKTTVAFDFGRISIGSGMDIHVYGTPGQARFNFMWDVLIQRAHAYILLVDAHRPGDLPHARQILTHMKERAQVPMIIGLTHQDCADALSIEAVKEKLGYRNLDDRPTVAMVNPNDKASVLQTVNLALLALLLSQVNSNSSKLPGVESVERRKAVSTAQALSIEQSGERSQVKSTPTVGATRQESFYF